MKMSGIILRDFPVFLKVHEVWGLGWISPMLYLGDFLLILVVYCLGWCHIPYHPCMVYLPTFAIKNNQM